MSSQHAEAAQPIKGIAIYIDKTTQISKKVTYTDLKDYDNSPKEIGQLITKNGITKRIYTDKQNNSEWLRFSDKPIIVVDAPGNVANKLKTMTIASQLPEFLRPDQYKVTEFKSGDAKAVKSIRMTSHSWYVDSRCRDGIITAHDWKVLLPAMIQYLNSDCTGSMPYNNTKSDIKLLTKHDISTSYKYKDEKWLDIIKKDCLQKRNSCTDLKQPTRAGLKP